MHLYRFTVCEAQELPRLPLVELELNGLPRRGHWPRNWEWRFTFTDAGRELRKDLRYLLKTGGKPLALAMGMDSLQSLLALDVVESPCQICQTARNVVQYVHGIPNNACLDGHLKKATAHLC
jgi:hypothetical protein